MSFLNRLFSKQDGNDKKGAANFSSGDIFYTHTDGEYHVQKLLSSEARFDTYHVLIYSTLSSLPELSDIDDLQVLVYHAPIDKNAFTDAVFLANRPVVSGDLIGYHEYLRQTRALEDYVSLASSYYKSGHSLTDQKRHTEAIDAYSKAIDLIPNFFEAIDNRAFCKMDMGMWREAIVDFELSLEVNPNTLLATFSIGECCFRLGDYHDAKTRFEKACLIAPGEQAPIKFLNKVNEMLKGQE